jgi:hypothetical protein
MQNVRALAERVRRLEAARAAPKSPLDLIYGSFDAFAQKMRADVEAGRLDRADVVGADGNGGILAALRCWHDEQLWGGWHRNRVWEYGG